ncbi:MAG: hypothetical protein JWO38_6082 [Gemmataceae bacterium]|nr:hypothetical protein [Gemmataceae bacterium]
MFRILALTAVTALALLPAARAEDAKPVELFNGKDLTGWKFKGDEKRSRWQATTAKLDPKDPQRLEISGPGPEGNWLVNTTPGSLDLYTEAAFGDALVELEFMIPKGSNSGIYLMGEYEVQILDSYGKVKVGPGDLGGIYHTAAPKVNASKKAGEWQKIVIDFRAPRFDGEKKVENAKFVKVTLNDQVIHENVETKGPTPGGLTGKEAPTGPLMFQGDHGAVAFRNIKITPKK